MDASKISRLREEQQKAILETQEQLRQLENYKSDYQTLQKRLETLPDKLSHDVMVPFGKLAYMPGRLVHTNEILVLLGDNWFVERSAKQACDIASRRMTELDKRIKELKDQQKLLEPRLGITSELQVAAEGKGDYREIIEEYDEEKEIIWDEQHKVNVRRHHEKMRKLKSSSKTNMKSGAESKKESPPTKTSDDDIWSRLDALEKQEDERGELNSSCESDNDSVEDRGQPDNTGSKRQNKVYTSGDKRVNWMDEETNESDGDTEEDDYDNDDEEEDESDESNSRPVVKTITFSHTKTPALPPPESQGAASSDATKITSPGEIYKLFSPKPILKKMTDSSDRVHGVTFPDCTGDHVLPSGNQETIRTDGNQAARSAIPVDTSREKAFTGIVKEKPTNAPTTATATSISTSQEQTKGVSRFRAQRMGQKSS